MANTVKLQVQRIRTVVRTCSTESVVRYCMAKCTKDNLPFHELNSPARQLQFLLGLLLESKEPDDAQDFGIRHWKDVVDALQMAFSAYSWSREQEVLSPTGPFGPNAKREEITWLAHIDYFDQTPLASTEQFAERIRLYLAPFDDQLLNDFGQTASDSLAIAEWIADSSQEKMDQALQEKSDLARRAGDGAQFQSSEVLLEEKVATEVPNLLQAIGKIHRSELIDRFNEHGEIFWEKFTIGRGEGQCLDYPTDPSVVERRPIIRLSDDISMYFSIEALYNAILLRGEECLSRGSHQAKYLRDRDKTLENQAETVLARILGKDAQFYRNLFETPNKQFEHDLIVLSDHICLIVEAKASPPVRPFRNPKKSFVRLRDRFRSKKGIQKSYNQAHRLLKSLQANNQVNLYDRHGNIVVQLSPEVAERAFCVCVTRDGYGTQASFLSLLLEKGLGDSYPWAVSILDLENIAEAWEYFRWGETQLKSFLSHRLPLHGRVLSNDELDFVGAYIQHCGLHHFSQYNYDGIILSPNYSDIFDEIHFHLFYNTPKVSIRPMNPANIDIAESAQKGEPVLVKNVPQGPIRVGRNERCPCGSGTKFKFCHGVR
ncbi:MAG: SEC-C domain-containing protein [Caldilineaceae bacterium]|nr:SEC-C domain-containing protein [Caldilineaceae bacterium]